MYKHQLLGTVSLEFDHTTINCEKDIRNDLSAVALENTKRLWVASDEQAGVESLKADEVDVFRNHTSVDLTKRFDLPEKPDPDECPDEIDIEGMAVSGDNLWITGSHTNTRRKTKDADDGKNFKRLAEVRHKPNRYVLGRLPVRDGKPSGKARFLPYSKHGNALTQALEEDPHLGPFLSSKPNNGQGLRLASKENGFDVEGLAARGKRVFLGLRGPVLRGWAAILIETALRKEGAHGLALKEIGRGGRKYRKHFVDLDGMGVRDLCWRGDDLLILAGPTMDLTGNQAVWQLRDAAGLERDSITKNDGKTLKRLFDLPTVRGADKAEGIELYDGLGESGVLVVYDGPTNERKPDAKTVLCDVFKLPAARV